MWILDVEEMESSSKIDLRDVSCGCPSKMPIDLGCQKLPYSQKKGAFL
jgi:hypothetical protein